MKFLKLNNFLLYIYIVAGICFLCADSYASDISFIKPVHVKSDIGYITFDKATEITPVRKYFFIYPQSQLVILENTPEYFIFLGKNKLAGYACKVPKIYRNMALIRITADSNKAYFRGGIEASTVPFKIKKNEELPILSKDEGGIFVSVRRGADDLKLYIPDSKYKYEVSKQSRFEIFSEKQKRKGLMLYNNEWLPEARVESIKKQIVFNKNQKERLLAVLKTLAQKGYVLLKDGTVLYGKYHGTIGKKVLFVSDKREHLFGPEDILDVPVSEALDISRLNVVEEIYNISEKLFKAKEYGLAMRRIEKAEVLLQKFDPASSKYRADIVAASKKLSSAKNSVKSILKENDLVLVQYTPFARELVDYHNARGNIYLKTKNVWVGEKQVCATCNGAGSVTCSACKGKGRTLIVCSNCKGKGKVDCHLCDGLGRKVCTTCGGDGVLSRKCSRCGGDGFINTIGYDYTPARYIYSSSGKLIAVHGACGYGYWYNRIECYTCGGTGFVDIKCRSCRGKGYLKCPVSEKCKACNGRGSLYVKCPVCSGAKKIKCPTCMGKGYNGKPAIYHPSGTQTEPFSSPSIMNFKDLLQLPE